jgi:hypothetical protein
MPTSQTARILLTDKAVKGVPFSTAKPQIVRDSKIAGFHLWVGKSTPLSTAQLECLQRVKEAGQTYYPEESKTWIFPAPGGHVAEVKEEGRLKLSHTGHALRHSFRTLAAAAGIDRLRLKILMNHAIDDDVTDAYATASTAPTGPTPSAPPSPPAASGWSTPTSPISTGASRSAAR